MIVPNIEKTLAEHKEWLDSNFKEGKRANLCKANLRNANLCKANLRNANLCKANLCKANLRNANLYNADLYNADLYNANLCGANLRNANLCKANLRNANLCGADLRNANLHNANLRNADLRGADIDFSCWPLWCGSFNVIVDRRIAAQLAYHFCRVICDDPGVVQCQKALYQLANTFHRVGELPRLGND